MSDLISRSAMSYAVRSLGEDFINEYKILYLIEHMDDAEPEERTAKVEWWDGYSEKGWYKCTCGKGVYQGQNYCAHCGAKMTRGER